MSDSPASASTPRRAAVAVCALLIAALGVLAGASTAFAHASLSSSSPGNQAVLDVAPTEIVLEFTEGVDPIEPGIRVIDADGDDVDIGAVEQSAGSDQLRVAIPPTLGDGSYVVAWQAVSTDSHRVRGSFTFSVGAPSAVTAGVLDGVFDDGGEPDTTDGVLLGVGRFFSYAGIGLLVGGLVLAMALTPSVIGSRRVGVLLIGAAVLAAVGTLWMLAAQADLIGGSIFAWGAVADTRSGRWWIARLVVIVLVGVLAAFRSRLPVRSRTAVALAFGLGVLAVVAAGGHAISGDAVVLGFVTTVVHLAAMSIWFGGLALLLVAPPTGEFWTRAVRFSPWALGSVAVLAVTGSLNAWRQLGSIGDLTSSSYGRWLVIKLVLVVSVIGLAAFSRRTVRVRGDGATALLRRSIGFEVAGIVLILAATAGLVNSPPPTDPPEVVSVSTVVGARVVQVELEPAITGGAEMHVYITSPSGALDRADEISVRAGLPAQDIAPFDVEVFPAGANHVIGSNVDLPVAGLWTVDVTARYGDFDEVVFTVQIPVAG